MRRSWQGWGGSDTIKAITEAFSYTIFLSLDTASTAAPQELEKDKWLCILSQKKFKAPEFVRKHVANKFADKVEEVKTDVEFFNNFIRDDKRPAMPLVIYTDCDQCTLYSTVVQCVEKSRG